jgi:aminoglycoside phosphotransferase family enzyme/predicted kinase
VPPATDQARLVAALVRGFDAGGVAPTRVLETHISYVLLTGAHAYKIKKAVEFAFVDYRTLEARRVFCEREVKLNRRLAPALYVDVVRITGTEQAPVLDGEGPAIEYAVKMREFPQHALASALLEHGELGAADIDALAKTVADFHQAIDVAAPIDGHGTPAGILRLALQNVAEIDWLAGTASGRHQVAELRGWTEREYWLRHDVLQRRLERGFVRECHGDLHLGNIARVDGELVVFDGIEFNDELRWIDTMSEIAFTVMDLEHRGRADLAHRFQNAYLEHTGDYAGLGVLSFYLVYRALVRAKVALLRAAQEERSVAGVSREGATSMSHVARGYLTLAARHAGTPQTALIVTCGLSGSGKTTLSQAMLEAMGAVRVRSDVERKRIRGVAPLERVRAGVDAALYSPEVTASTYARLRDLARAIVGGGRIAIVDASFLRRSQRESFRALAAELGVPFVLLALEADEATLRRRIADRAAKGTDASDADLAVLAHQVATREPLTADERSQAVVCDADAPLEAARALAASSAVSRRIAA